MNSTKNVSDADAWLIGFVVITVFAIIILYQALTGLYFIISAVLLSFQVEVPPFVPISDSPHPWIFSFLDGLQQWNKSIASIFVNPVDWNKFLIWISLVYVTLFFIACLLLSRRIQRKLNASVDFVSDPIEKEAYIRAMQSHDAPQANSDPLVISWTEEKTLVKKENGVERKYKVYKWWYFDFGLYLGDARKIYQKIRSRANQIRIISWEIIFITLSYTLI